MFPLLLVAALWLTPVTPFTPIRGFDAPQHAFAAGHRGLDVRAVPGQPVRSPLSGTVTFAGTVAGRGVVTVANGNTRVSLEPVNADIAAGTPVLAGGALGVVGSGGHCSNSCLHIGVRVDGDYANPVRRFSRVRLLPLR